MADKKISQLPDLWELSGDEQFPLVKDNENYKVSLSNIKESIIPDKSITAEKLDAEMQWVEPIMLSKALPSSGTLTGTKVQSQLGISASALTNLKVGTRLMYKEGNAIPAQYIVIATTGSSIDRTSTIMVLNSSTKQSQLLTIRANADDNQYTFTTTSIADGAIRYDVRQELANAAKSTALTNVGAPTLVIAKSLIGKALSGNDAARMWNMTTVIVYDEDSGLYRTYTVGDKQRETYYFYAPYNDRQYRLLTYAALAEQFMEETIESYPAGEGVLRYDVEQNLTDNEKILAFSNAGIKVAYITSDDLIVGVASDELVAKLEAASFLIYTITTNVPEKGQQYLMTKIFEDINRIKFESIRLYGENDTLHYSRVLGYRIELVKASKLLRSSSINVGLEFVGYNEFQFLTTPQKSLARTNIAAMANTPSGDPMHYMYEAAGAEWVPYASISTGGLKDWQIATLDDAQAKADGGMWWHNGIFVTVAQNRINYIETIGQYLANMPDYQYYLDNTLATTNYKQVVSVDDRRNFDATIRRGWNLTVVVLPNLNLLNMTFSLSECPRLRKVIGIIKVSTITSPIIIAVGTPNLEEIQLSGVNVNLDIKGTQKLSMASLAYMINNAGTATLAITLDSNVYIAAQSDADVQAALTAKTNVTLADAGAANNN